VEGLRRAVVVGVSLEARVVDPTNAWVAGQELGHLACVLAVPLKPQVEGFDSLENQPGVERRDAGALVAQALKACLECEGHVPERGVVAEDLPELKAVVAGVGLGEVRETSAAPIEVATVNHDAADGRSVAAEELGQRVDDDVGAEGDRVDQVGRWHRVIDSQRDAVLLADGRDFGDGEGVELGVTDRLAIEKLRVGCDGLAEVLRIRAIDEDSLDAQLGKRVVEKAIGSAVEA